MNNAAMHQSEKGWQFRQHRANYKRAVGEKGGEVMNTGYQLLGLLISQNDLGDGVSLVLFPENVAKYSTAKLVLIFDQNVLFCCSRQYY